MHLTSLAELVSNVAPTHANVGLTAEDLLLAAKAAPPPSLQHSFAVRHFAISGNWDPHARIQQLYRTRYRY